MASLGLFSNCPSFPQRYHNHNAAVSPPPDHFTFHDNFTIYSDTCMNNPLSFQSTHQFSTFNNGVNTTTNLPFQNTIRYPTLSSSSSSYNNPFMTLQHEQLLPTPVAPLMSYPTDQFSGYSHDQCYQYPLIDPNNVWPMEHFQPELLPPFPEIYDYHDGGGGGGSALMQLPPENYGLGCEVKKQNGNYGGRSLSAQSMAARVRRRKISEKTSELGKLVPGGHQMNTAEMFQAAFKYVKFLQAQVGVLQLIHESPEPIEEELQALVTSPTVQEKLYAAEKCIATQTLARALANDQGIKH